MRCIDADCTLSVIGVPIQSLIHGHLRPIFEVSGKQSANQNII